MTTTAPAYTKARPPAINTGVGMGLMQKQQPAAVTPSPVGVGAGVGAGIQKHSFISPVGGGGTRTSNGDFDGQQGHFLVDITNAKDKGSVGRRGLLSDNVELSEAFMNANEMRSELISLLEDIEEVLEW